MKKTHKILLRIFIGLIIITSGVSFVLADGGDDDDDEIDDEFELENERQVYFNIESDRIEFDSILKNTQHTQDEINFRIDLSDDIKIQVSYEEEFGSEEFDLEYEIYIDRIFEFEDDGDGIFNEENDTILQEYLLENFSQPQHTEILDEFGSKIHYVNTSTGDGVFTLHTYISEQFEIIGQSLLSPTQLKVDFEINQFPYLQGNSSLSLRVEMNSDLDEYEHDEETEDEEEGLDEDEDSFQLTTNNITGFFSWKEYALIDGLPQNVTLNTKSEMDGDELEYYLFLTYTHGEKIIHDPKLGIGGILISPADPSFLWIIIISSISVVILSTFGILMSKSEYREFIRNRVLHINKGAHTLTVEEVFDNEMRNKILDLIIDDPGIHYKELFRKAETSASNLAWHLDILETYKIIKKTRVGNYLVFYPYIDKNPFAEFNHNLVKSKTTLEVFEIIGGNPGIHSSKIAHRLELDHKTVKYHIDKLKEVNLIRTEKQGRKTLFFADLPMDD